MHMEQRTYPYIGKFYASGTVVHFIKPLCGFILHTTRTDRHFMEYREDWEEDYFNVIEG